MIQPQQTGYLSRTTSYALYINGPFRARELENLLRLLNLQLEWLRDDEAEAERKARLAESTQPPE